jgi:hypothetical protein
MKSCIDDIYKNLLKKNNIFVAQADEFGNLLALTTHGDLRLQNVDITKHTIADFLPNPAELPAVLKRFGDAKRLRCSYSTTRDTCFPGIQGVVTMNTVVMPRFDAMGHFQMFEMFCTLR